MAWGTNAPQGADDLLSKAQRGGSLCVMPFRRFGAEECAALCAGLPSTGVLELLASGHAIGEAGAAAVGGMLAQYRPLRRLAVGDSSFGDAGADALLRGLGDAPCGLEALELDYKGLGEPGARAVSALLCRAGALRELTLARNPLQDGGVEALGEGLRAAMALESLDLSESGMTARGVEALGRAAREGGLRALRQLRVSRNAQLRDEGAGAVAALLAALPALRSCWAEGCEIGAAGGEALGAAAEAACAAGSALQALNLDGNAALGGGGAVRALAASGLSELRLGGCGVAEAAAEEMRHAHPALATLDLHSNQLGPRAAAALGGMRSLRSLRVFANPLGDQAAICLAPRHVHSVGPPRAQRRRPVVEAALSAAAPLLSPQALGVSSPPHVRR
jgi:hypothetical protein